MKEERCFCCDKPFPNCNCGESEGYSYYGAVCPHCGKVDLADESEGYLYNESNDTNYCSSCSKEYRMEVSISYTWSTFRIEE